MRNPIVSIILLLLSGAIYYAFTGDALQKISQDKDSSVAADHTIEQGQQLKGLTADINDKVQSISSDPATERIRAVLPLVLDPILVLNDVDAIIKNHGMKPQALALDGTGSVQSAANTPSQPSSVKASSSGTTPVPHTITFTVATSYPQFIKLLADIQQSLEMVEIKSVTFAAPGAGDRGSGKSGTGDSNSPSYSVTLTTVALK